MERIIFSSRIQISYSARKGISLLSRHFGFEPTLKGVGRSVSERRRRARRRGRSTGWCIPPAHGTRFPDTRGFCIPKSLKLADKGLPPCCELVCWRNVS